MWNKFKTMMGIHTTLPYFSEVIQRLHQEVIKRNFIFHLVTILFELIMIITISMRPGGPFLKPRRTAYFIMYLLLILVTLGVTIAEAFIDKKQQERSWLYYFRIENAYIIFFSLWGVAVTLNDQLGGNGLTVFTYVMILASILTMLKPWQTLIVIMGSFCSLNILLPYFPDPYGLNQSYNNFMNSLFIAITTSAIAASLYHSRIEAKVNEIIIMKQFENIESQNKQLHQEARFDALTSLNNRFSYKKDIQNFSKKTFNSFACIYMDANGLHEINNHFGHKAGDTMLKAVADILMHNFRLEEVYRIGGDEFVILCPNITRQMILQKASLIYTQVEEAGYSLSVGVEWRDRDFEIEEIIQTAEADMQKQKKQYYLNQPSERQKRLQDKKTDHPIAGTNDIDIFLNVLGPAFLGVYVVDIEIDTVRHIFIPDYFKQFLEASDYKYSSALMQYAHSLVEPQYIPLFEECCDYPSLKKQLKKDRISEFCYIKKDGSSIRVRILNFDRKTLWIFSNTDTPR